MPPPSLANASPVDWRHPPAKPAAGELHLWTWTADGPLANAAHLAWLDVGQRQRHARLVTEVLRRRFLAAHAGVRRVLAGYLGITPNEVTFCQTDLGKPFIEPEEPQFNLAHSGEAVLLAVGGSPVGVDVEQVRTLDHLEALAMKYLTRSEQEQYNSLDRPTRCRAFFRLWSRKEAVVKLTGLGLQASVQELQIGCHPTAIDQWVTLPERWPTPLAGAWLWDIDAPDPLVAAVASADRVRQFRLFSPE